jgi:hypothetical protein
VSTGFVFAFPLRVPTVLTGTASEMYYMPADSHRANRRARTSAASARLALRLRWRLAAAAHVYICAYMCYVLLAHCLRLWPTANGFLYKCKCFSWARVAWRLLLCKVIKKILKMKRYTLATDSALATA